MWKIISPGSRTSLEFICKTNNTWLSGTAKKNDQNIEHTRAPAGQRTARQARRSLRRYAKGVTEMMKRIVLVC